MTPEQRMAAKLNGLANRMNRLLEPIERRARLIRPETEAERWRRLSREANRPRRRD